MSREPSYRHGSLTTVTIRQTLRLKRRSEQTHKSFQEIRKKMQQQQYQQRLERENERMKKIPICTNQFMMQQKAPIPQPTSIASQNYHQNLCFNVNIANLNIHKNGQQFHPQFHNFNQTPFNFNGYPHEGFNQVLNYIKPFMPIPTNLPSHFQMNQRDPPPVTRYYPKHEHKNFPPLNQNDPKRPENNIVVQSKKRQILLKHGNYLVYNEILGTGSYSKVYLGLNLLTNVQVAIKEISELEENQIKVLMSIQSPYIIKLQSSWKNNYTNLTYLVLDLCQRNLRQQIKMGISFSQKLKYFDDVFCGMDVLFSKNIIHRDLKFENILVSKDKIAKITDFGLAKDMGLMSNVASFRCGTPYTMAPQIFLHNGYGRPYYNQKCDIWSLAVILHEIIHNRHPFNLETARMEKMNRVRVQKRYGYLDLLIDKSLVKNPNNRISWEQFKNIYQSKGQYGLPMEMPPAAPQEGSNFKKKFNGKQMKISEQYKAYEPNNGTPLLVQIKKRIQKEQMELRQVQNKQNEQKDVKRINNYLNNIILPKSAQPLVDNTPVLYLQNKQDKQDQVMLLHQGPRIVQKPMMQIIKVKKRDKPDYPDLYPPKISRNKCLIPPDPFAIRQDQPKQQIKKQIPPKVFMYVSDSNNLKPVQVTIFKIMFFLILGMLLWTINVII